MTYHEKQLMEKVYKEIETFKNTVNSDPHRLTYHLMPPVGLLNDPNGLIQYKGVYHVFYQWNPFDVGHGAKFWGHYTSEDLVHWREEPIALAPSEWYEKNGCYSGSAIKHGNKLILFYTGNVKDEHDQRQTYQCMAVSRDGIHFDKKGLVIELPQGYTAHFRDPKVWKKDDMWYMILGAQTLSEQGAAVLFSSNDLNEWKHLGIIAGSGMNGLSEFGYMWECPDLFELDGKDVLLVSPQGLEPEGNLFNNLFQSGYFIGSLDYAAPAFQHGTFTELDRGFDFYAPQTMLDAKGRRIMYGWMGMTDENEPFQPTVDHQWIHALTLPRELKLKNDKLIQQPVEELQLLRNQPVTHLDAEIHGDVAFDEIGGRSVELILNFKKFEAETFKIKLRNNSTLVYHTGSKQLILERKNFKDGTIEQRACHLDTLCKLQIFLDTSSIEIFVNDGEEVFTARYFPDVEDESISFFSNGKVVCDLEKWMIG
ncbi:glycoside hydrolase family 32 protein [Bacillus sp. V33-4]|uniref:glycoside hydrolase family 32 protein n=1 Tax=Bacillus sp. V33-4 TaxID=2054169 RepID=UPI000C792F1B|nr:sucrose-6-phosphate hydrolase [Bacillus sp. V33-4]PLR84876.1 sucrose-6-phosphate hydrolase [Bacillus sp. V33-4]